MMEGYKDSPLGMIPNDWEIVTLGEIGNTFNGLTGKTKVDFGSGKPYITYMNIFSNPKLKNDFVDFVEIGEIENQNSVQYGDIFFTTSSETVDEVGFSSVLLDKVEECYLNSFCFGFRMKDFQSLLPEYAVYLLRGEKSRKIISVLAQGSTRFNLSKINLLKKLYLSLPPLPEQQKIAEILSTVDAKIEVIDQQITETQALKKGLMQRLLTKGIGHTEFKDSALGEIPKSWEVSSLESHSAFITKGSTPTTYGFHWEETGVQFLRSECVSPNGFILSGAMFISEEANNAMERSKIKGGDILMTITGNVGRVCIYPTEYLTGNINQHIARIRITDKLISSQFIFQFLSQSTQIQEYLKITTGQAYPQLSLKQVRETKIPIPPLKEQTKIAEILSSVDDKLEVLSEKKTHYLELKQGLMQQLLTGKIRVKTDNTVTA